MEIPFQKKRTAAIDPVQDYATFNFVLRRFDVIWKMAGMDTETLLIVLMQQGDSTDMAGYDY